MRKENWRRAAIKESSIGITWSAVAGASTPLVHPRRVLHRVALAGALVPGVRVSCRRKAATAGQPDPVCLLTNCGGSLSVRDMVASGVPLMSRAWTSKIEQDEEGGCFIRIPDGLLSDLGWKIGDELCCAAGGEGQVTLRRIDLQVAQSWPSGQGKRLGQ